MKVLGVHEPAVGKVAVCSLGRVGVITDRKEIAFSNGDKGLCWVGMGFDGKGLWASSEPMVLCDSLKEYTARILEKPSNVLYGQIAVPPPPKPKKPVDGVELTLGYKPE